MPDSAEKTLAAGEAPPDAQSTARMLAVLALLSIALGLAVQLAIVVIRIAYGTGPGLSAIAVSFAGGVTWSLLVCMGVGIGAAVMRMRPALSGLLGLVIAPIAVALAKASQRIVSGLMQVAEQEAILSLGSVSLARAAEYGVLGYLLGTLAQRGDRRLSRYIGAGVIVGLVLGGAVVAITISVAQRNGGPPATPVIAATVINEMVFPVCCAVVIFAAQMAGQTLNRGELAISRIKV
jgi:hypothetical protein